MSGDDRRDPQIKSLTDLMVAVIQSPIVGLWVVERAGELIAEYARYNVWVYERKPRSTTPEMWNMAELSSRSNSACLSAWQTYAASSREEDELEEFLGVLTATLNTLKSARENDSVELDDSSMPQELRDWL